MLSTTKLIGPKNSTNSEYCRLHAWVRRKKQKPKTCEDCGKITDKLQAANISGEYYWDLEDYKYVCQHCHCDMDNVSERLTGRVFTEEHRQKISKALKGKIVSEETREKLRIINTGKKASEETKAKLRKKSKELYASGYIHPNTGRPLSLKHKQNISKAQIGSKHSEETKQKISDARKEYMKRVNYVPWNKDKKMSEEHNKKISKGLLKHHETYTMSDETKLKMSKSIKKTFNSNGFVHPLKGKHHSDETKLKIAEANKNRNISDKTKAKLRKLNLGKNNNMYGKKHNEETKRKISEAIKLYHKNKKLKQPHI